MRLVCHSDTTSSNAESYQKRERERDQEAGKRLVAILQTKLLDALGENPLHLVLVLAEIVDEVVPGDDAESLALFCADVAVQMFRPHRRNDIIAAAARA